MLLGLQVLRIHISELCKVKELCRDFSKRYITSLSLKMQSENLIKKAIPGAEKSVIFDFRPPSKSIAFTLDWVTILTWDFFPAKIEFLIDDLKLVSSIYLKRFACGNDLKLKLAKKVQILICSFHEFWDFAKNTQFSKCHRSQSTQPIFKFKYAMDS